MFAKGRRAQRGFATRSEGGPGGASGSEPLPVRSTKIARPVSLQPVSALVAAIVSFAIGGSVLLREPRRRAHVLFATLSFNIAAFCLISFFAKRFDSPFLGWMSLLV